MRVDIRNGTDTPPGNHKIFLQNGRPAAQAPDSVPNGLFLFSFRRGAAGNACGTCPGRTRTAVVRAVTPPRWAPRRDPCGPDGSRRHLSALLGNPRHSPAAAVTFWQARAPSVVAVDIDAQLAAAFYPDPPDRVPPYDRDLASRLREMGRRTGCYRDFYRSPAWRRLRAEVLASMHGESLVELAASPARFVRADTVHHVLRVSRWPGYALHPWALDEEGRVVRNLIPLSHAAHDAVHGRAFGGAVRNTPLTEEWW